MWDVYHGGLTDFISGLQLVNTVTGHVPPPPLTYERHTPPLHLPPHHPHRAPYSTFQLPLYRDFHDHHETTLAVLEGRATSELVDWVAISKSVGSVEFFSWGDEREGPMHVTCAIKKVC